MNIYNEYIYSGFNTDNLYFYAKFPMIIIVIITINYITFIIQDL